MSSHEIDTAFVRAFTEDPSKGPRKRRTKLNEPSDRVLVIDTETTTDPAQALRFGVYQLRRSGHLLEAGLFYDPACLGPAEMAVLEAYATARELVVLTVGAFRDDVVIGWAYEGNATIVGLNLPFDISRIAIGWGEARQEMRGGFSFHMQDNPYAPRIRIKHLSSTSSLIDFSKPSIQTSSRSIRNREEWVPAKRGYFVDLRTFAAALTSRKHSLGSLARLVNAATQKRGTDEHGGPLTADYLAYACDDVQATWECFEALSRMYDEHDLDKSMHRIFSEASIGKAYLEAMGVSPLIACQPDTPSAELGAIMSTYFGGRAEVRTRKQITQVHYCDFKSMYPTVNALMGLWRFLIADGYTQEDTTIETQALLDRITLADLQKRETWELLTTLVRLKPDEDVLPLRTRYSRDKDNLTIGLNGVSSVHPLNYTLADVIASKLLTGQPPQIERATTFRPGSPQSDLKPIQLFGRPEYAIDPRSDDVFVRLVDLRDEAKSRSDPNEKAIKIIANASCYGIFVEVQRDDAPKPERLKVYGPDGEGFETSSTAIEQPGNFFNPLLATLITGAARLMLATAERLAADQELDWVFCDTDSIAMARRLDMSEREFLNRANSVIDWFEGLNPYAKQGSILRAEDQNFDPATGEPKPLYCYAISAKRYALFNVENGIPVIRKLSAHGLGHLMKPYADDSPPNGIPEPAIPIKELGVPRWIHDFWFQIISAALVGKPNQVALDYHPNLQSPALMKYSATSPALLRWLRHHNDGKPYSGQVKPFGFLVSLSPRTGAFANEIEIELIDRIKRGRPRKCSAPKPIAPFEKDGLKAAEMAFDRESGEPVSVQMLKTYAEALSLYHMSAEDKFENGGPWDVGPTERRQLSISGTRLIGKEANKVGGAGQENSSSPACLTYKCIGLGGV